MYTKLTINETDLPSPTKLSVTREQLWNSKTGRSVKSGKMLGAVIAEKRTLDVEWSRVTGDEFKIIRDALTTGFFGPVKYETSEDKDGKVVTLIKFDEAYHGPITYTDRGYIGSNHWYENVKTTIIER